MNKVFTVSLCNPDKDVYVTLDVPADPYTILDAWERLRPAPDTRVEWEMEDYGGIPPSCSLACNLARASLRSMPWRSRWPV